MSDPMTTTLELKEALENLNHKVTALEDSYKTLASNAVAVMRHEYEMAEAMINRICQGTNLPEHHKTDLREALSAIKRSIERLNAKLT